MNDIVIEMKIGYKTKTSNITPEVLIHLFEGQGANRYELEQLVLQIKKKETDILNGFDEWMSMINKREDLSLIWYDNNTIDECIIGYEFSFNCEDEIIDETRTDLMNYLGLIDHHHIKSLNEIQVQLPFLLESKLIRKIQVLKS